MHCDICPKRADCTALCPEMYAQLPKPDEGRDWAFWEKDTHAIWRLTRAKAHVDTLRAHDYALLPRQRVIFDMYYREGLSIAEIAEREGVRPNTVALHLSRARARIGREIDRVMNARRERRAVAGGGEMA